MEIKIHSFVDVITNSSTTIYTRFKKNSPELVYEMINEILKVGESDQKAEDLFDVSLHPEITSAIERLEYMENDELDRLGLDPEIYNLIKNGNKVWASENYEGARKWEKKNEYGNKLADYLLKDNFWEKILDMEDWETDIYITIKAKDPNRSALDLGGLIQSMFYYEEGDN